MLATAQSLVTAICRESPYNICSRSIPLELIDSLAQQQIHMLHHALVFHLETEVAHRTSGPFG